MIKFLAVLAGLAAGVLGVAAVAAVPAPTTAIVQLAAGGNGDADDIDEDGSWLCPNGCGAGGRCVKGDEAIAEALHLMVCPNR